MYKRFLITNDYIGIVSEEALLQLVRGNPERLAQAEEAAEVSILEYLSENYEVEAALAVGKNIMDYNPQITYPVGSHFYSEGVICEALRTINGYKAPSSELYWSEYDGTVDTEQVEEYTQLHNYYPDDIVMFAGQLYQCHSHNGLDFKNIRIPGIYGWEAITAYQWQPNLDYALWEVVVWEGNFYTLADLTNIDLTQNPLESDNWGLIGTYDKDYNAYEFSANEYVVLEGAVYVPTMNVNYDQLTEGYNYRINDPRNPNLKKHILRIALYDLHKLISPNNVSSARITDYEVSITWLRDASKMRINPQIARKLDDENKPVGEWAVATFMRDYDPHKNPWQI
ncbi:MAG: hypothetical protein R3Y68_03135 [Rikenellaceae bacterium]